MRRGSREWLGTSLPLHRLLQCNLKQVFRAYVCACACVCVCVCQGNGWEPHGGVDGGRWAVAGPWGRGRWAVGGGGAMGAWSVGGGRWRGHLPHPDCASCKYRRRGLWTVYTVKSVKKGSVDSLTICFTICLYRYISPDLDGCRAPKMNHDTLTP
jgi:hypothetical protein